MSQDTLSEFVAATATRFGIPGVAVGVWADAQEGYACHGVTSLDNPLPVDPDTLYLLGSITKTPHRDHTAGAWSPTAASSWRRRCAATSPSCASPMTGRRPR
jgi:hypothetical protein